MTDFRIEMVGLGQLKAVLAKLNIKNALPSLFRSLGDVYVSDVRNRIRTQDGGRWKPVSKWIRAKKGVTKALSGMERYVLPRVTPTGLFIQSDLPVGNLDMHHRGFINPIYSRHDRTSGRAVILSLRMPSALGVKKKEFRFVPDHAAKTPARKIWPAPREVHQIGAPVASRWLKKVLKDAGVK